MSPNGLYINYIIPLGLFWTLPNNNSIEKTVHNSEHYEQVHCYLKFMSL